MTSPSEKRKPPPPSPHIAQTASGRQHRGGSPQRYVLSEQQRRLLLERYGKVPLEELLPAFPGVPVYRVYHWARQLGLARRKARWTEDEEAYLARQLPAQGLRGVQKRLAARTPTALRRKAQQMDVPRREEGYYSLRAAAAGLGVNPHALSRWIQVGWLPARRRERADGSGDGTFVVSDGDLRAFVRAHPEQINPRRAEWLWLLDVLLGGLGELADPLRRASSTSQEEEDGAAQDEEDN